MGSRSLRERTKDLLARAMTRDSAQRLALQLNVLPRFVEWCRSNSCPVVNDRYVMHRQIMDTVGRAEVLNFLEFGVFEGESFRWWVEGCTNPEARFVGFDTFSGLPEDWTPELREGHFDVQGRVPDIDDHRVTFLPGLFQETLPSYLENFRPEARTVVHLDADLFSATLFVLITLLPRLKQGDILVFDEFHDYVDEFRALESASSAFPFEFRTIVAMPGYADRGYARVALVIS